MEFFLKYKEMLLTIYKYYSSNINDPTSAIFMTIGGFTKFLREAGLIFIDNSEKIVNYKIKFPFNLTLASKGKSLRSSAKNNLFNNTHSNFNVITLF